MVKRFLFGLAVVACHANVLAGDIVGKVIDAANGDPLIGASVTFADGQGVSTDLDGRFALSLPNGRRVITVRYIGYRTMNREVSVGDDTSTCDFSLEQDDHSLSAVTIVGEAQQKTEASLIKEQKESNVAMTSVSEQYIKKTQDKDASEIIRRIPGISIIDDKFVMIRGLAQRYNNVWINGSAVPSSEADQRAFSFDIVPSSQIDNMKVIKSASPEYPADFSGGFVVLNTKDVPAANSWNVSIGGGYNEKTHFLDYLGYGGSSTDFLGFDNGKRSMADGLHTKLSPQLNGYSLLGNGFDNDWTVKTRNPMADLSLSTSFSRRWTAKNWQTLGLNGSVNYSNSYTTLVNIVNNMFGAYDVTHDSSNYLRKASDDQYANNVRLGAMLGLIWLSPSSNHRVELKQIFNQLGKSRYTYRKGFDAQSDYTEQAEYYYQSRSTYNLGLAGKHTLGEQNQLEWKLGYAYANRNLPDRRRYSITEQEDKQTAVENLNDINREFSYLGENIYSAGGYWKRDLSFGKFSPTLKVGVYGEYKSRKYDTRLFTYAWPNGQLPDDMRTLDVSSELIVERNYGPDGLYLLEQVDWSNNYEASNHLESGFLSLQFPLLKDKLNVYGGLRLESSHTELISHTRRQEYSPLSTHYDYIDLFPSLNLAYKLTDEHQLRMSYGRTTNRPEFRELSTSVYYDFDLASNVQGNHKLLPAYINNVDLAWEWYPNAGELLSVSLFYKHFMSPIEWTYTVAGGTDLVYSYMNAESANNFGVELDIRKQLDFLNLPQLSLSLNAALIKSNVDFAEGSREKDRPMQGQSPYLVNIGLFYNSDDGNPAREWRRGWTAALLYNTIGKRIIGVGRSIGVSDIDVRVPDSYEMPRHQIDINVGKSLGRFDLRLSVRNLLSQKVQFKQFETTPHGEIEQVTRSYSPGRTISLTAAYKLK